MKKIYTIFLIGQLLILSFIFNKSIYDLYGLSHIGDTSLNGYKIGSIKQENLSRLYDALLEENATIQLIKTPISKSDSNQTDYEIYHSDISSVRKFVSVSDNQYTYFDLTKEDFVDGTGVFYTNLSEKQMTDVSEKIGSSISAYTQKSYTSIDTMLMANGSELVMLFVMTFGVIVIYVIARNKENAVKVLLGYSGRDIVGNRVKETFFLELVSIGAIVIGNMVYYGFQKKLSVFYVLFLMLFLVAVAAINALLVFLTNMCVKKVNVVDAIKNKRFSGALDYVVQVTKIVLVLIIVIIVSSIKQDYNALTDAKKQMETYKKLDSFYCSYGYNSDAYEKMETDDALYLQNAEKVKELYQQYSEQAYVMENCVLDLQSEEMGDTEEDIYGMTKEELFQSYKQNYIVVNKNYLEKFMDVTILSGEIKKDCPTILVPERYKKEEQKIREQYKLYFEESYLADSYYGKKETITISAKDLNVVYVEDDYEVDLLSDLRYENDAEITIKSPIIMIDGGNFASTRYMDMFSNCELAFRLQNRGELSEMLEKAGLETVFAARTMMAPFMDTVSNYKFLVEQKEVFLVLFVLTLIFLIYISNYIHVYVNSKRYGVKYEMGYSNGRIVAQDIGTTLLLCCLIPILTCLKIDVASYGLFILLDFVMFVYFYKNIIVKDLYKIMNGGC